MKDAAATAATYFDAWKARDFTRLRYGPAVESLAACRAV